MSKSRKAALTKVLYFTMMIFLFAVTVNHAQEERNVVLTLGNDAIGNLKNAITSENPGLRKSGIYLAGKHTVKEVASTLLEQLNNESDPELKILIIRVLYIIDENEYMNEIHQLALNEENDKVRQMASAIYSVMQINSSDKVAASDN